MARPLPLKTRIFHHLIALLEPLKVDGLVRTVERGTSHLATSKQLPNIFLVEGQELQINADLNNGRAYKFPVLIMVTLAKGGKDQERAELKDEIVARIQEILEAPANLQLGGLCVVVDGVAETPYVQDVQATTAGALITCDVTYRRRRGSPRQQY